MIVPDNATLEEASDALVGKVEATYLFFRSEDLTSTVKTIRLGVVGDGRSHFLPIGVRVSTVIYVTNKKLLKM